MTKKTKVLATSIASIAMCASIAVGGTFALFTSESEVNVAVTSGKVKMNALVDTNSVALTSLGEAMTGNTWANGGVANVAAGEVVLTNVTPGDKITFNIDITNESTVNVQYRTVVSCVEGLDLFSGLVVTLEYANDVEDSQTFNGLTAYGAWNALAPDVQDVDTVKVTIELPNRSNGLVFGEDNLDNQYQGLSTKLNYRVEAVQGNAGVQDDAADANTVLAYSANDMELIARQVNSGNSFAGKTVKMMKDIKLDMPITTFALNSEAESNWTPIGTSSNPFKGTFDGQGHTIKNLVLNETGKSYIGVFGHTRDGEIKNLTVENATVVGRLSVGVVAGMPYTSNYSNITVKGDVYVDGMSYVGGVGGRNAYGNWTDITVDVNEGSYVNASSVENGTAYRTYVGGVIGFMGEGNHVVSNVTSNIDVIGSTIDVGGIVGIAHYGNTFKNCYSNGDVTVTGAESAADAEEIGGIAGVWMDDARGAVTFADCVFEGTLSANITEGVDLSDNTIVGKAYNENGTGTLDIYNFFYVDGVQYLKDGVSGEIGLYLVPANYAGETVNVAEGTTYIGGSSFSYNKNVKKVVMPSTLKKVNTNAFKNSPVEEVVLNEGFTTLADRAFSQAYSLKKINFPSTLTRIETQAFRNTGLEELIIPATVTEIAERAFSNLNTLTTIIVEGNPVIANYAFRSCANLTTIKFLGNNVVFTGTSQLFCRTDNALNMDQITAYVVNAEMAARVDKAQRGGGAIGYNVVIAQTADENGVYEDENGNSYAYASDETALKNAANGGAATVYLSAGEVKLPAGLKSEVTITGTTDTTVEIARGTSMSGASITFKGLTIQGLTDGEMHSYQMDGAQKVVYEDCVIIASLTLYCDTEFINCTFINDVDGRYSVYCYGECDYSFEKCTFEGTAGRGIKLYREGDPTAQTVTAYVKDCEFASTNNKKAGIEIDSTFCTYIVYVSGCTLTGATEKVWNADAGENANLTVYEENVKVFPNA